jgi:hypothetical protein
MAKKKEKWLTHMIERTGKPYLSYSSIKYALQDMALFELYMMGKLKKDSEALQFGSAYDCMLFTPEMFNDKFFVLDDSEIYAKLIADGAKSPRSTVIYKDWKAEQDASIGERTVLSQEDHQQIIDMISRLEDCGIIDIYLTGDYQVEFNEEVDGIPLRGFLDCKGNGFITDSKSTRSISGFRSDVRYLGYDIQAYLYCKVFGYEDFYWVAQEKSYPYVPAVYKASEQTLRFGEEKFNRAVNTIREHFEKNMPSSTFYLEGEI